MSDTGATPEQIETGARRYYEKTVETEGSWPTWDELPETELEARQIDRWPFNATPGWASILCRETYRNLVSRIAPHLVPPGYRIIEETPAIVCLCGSGRFREAFEQAEFDETLSGKIVLTIGCNTKDIARDIDWQHVKPMLDELHLRKIDLADEVLIVNVGDYIGESTARELAYARERGKRVRWWEPTDRALPGEETPDRGA